MCTVWKCIQCKSVYSVKVYSLLENVGLCRLIIYLLLHKVREVLIFECRHLGTTLEFHTLSSYIHNSLLFDVTFSGSKISLFILITQWLFWEMLRRNYLTLILLVNKSSVRCLWLLGLSWDHPRRPAWIGTDVGRCSRRGGGQRWLEETHFPMGCSAWEGLRSKVMTIIWRNSSIYMWHLVLFRHL